MKLYEECKNCLISSQMKKAIKQFGGEKAQIFRAEAQKVCDGAPKEYCAPLLMRDLDRLCRRLFGEGLNYSLEKKQFNGALLKLDEELYSDVSLSSDPVREAVKLAMAANYIDFTKISAFDEGAVGAVLSAAERSQPSEKTLALFKADMSTAKTLLYLHDNCGEVVLDKILIRVLKAAYPQINVISVVRGGEIINDATMADARQVDLFSVAEVIENGADIPGTYTGEINAKTRELLNGCDVIISKGLGNLETLSGEGYSVYYMFMAKCAHMAERFSVPLMDTVLYKE